MNNIKRKIIQITATALLFTITFIMTSPFAKAIEWSSDTPLTTDSSWDVNPSITQVADGTIWVVWASDREAIRSDLYYKTSSDMGSSWSDPTPLTTDSRWDDMPSIIQTLDGTVWVVWMSDRTYDYELYYKTSADMGSSWSDPTPLTTNPGRDTSPSITQAANGTIWVVWSRDVAGNYDIFYKTSSDMGSSWSSDTPLTTDSSWDVNPSITQVADGTIWVVWASFRTGDYDVFYKTSSDMGSSWSDPTPLTTDSSWDDDTPSIAQAANGTIWVVWASDRVSIEYELIYRTSVDMGSSWSEDIQLTKDPKQDESPSVTSTNQARMWVVWASDRTLDFEIFYKISDVIPAHDIAITSVAPSSTSVYEGHAIDICVKVRNEGAFSEAFNVTAYYNSTAIETQNVTDLAPDADTTLTFTWNTTGVSPAHYTISATAHQVPGEIDLMDNSLIDGTIQVKMMGDVNGDGVIDIVDATLMVKHFITYDPRCDFNQNGRADVQDASILVLAFAE